MLPKLIFATINPHKVEEIRLVAGHAFQVITLQDAGIHISIPEPYDTLEANASHKSATIHRITGQHCFSEDTGLEVAILGGEPGVKTARYAGENSSARDNMDKLLEQMMHHTDRAAKFRTVISLILDEKEHQFEGICEGTISTEPIGAAGFGYDPIFIPTGASKTFAEMDMTEKSLYSHRRKAVDQLIAFLNKRIQP